MDHFIVNYFNQICRPCNRKESCLEHCQEYLDYLDRVPNNENKRDIHILKVDHLTHEKKEELMKLIEQYSGRLEISDMDFGDVRVEYNDGIGIDDLFEYSVEDQIWINIINEKVHYTEIVDKDALLNYLVECNEKYCNEQGLCHVCRTPLVEKTEMEEIWGSMQTSEKYWCCPNGC